MWQMHATSPNPRKRPVNQAGFALVLVALLALAVAIGAAVRHDTGTHATATEGVVHTTAQVADSTAPASPIELLASDDGRELLLACSVLILCCVALLAHALLARTSAAPGARSRHPIKRPIAATHAARPRSVSLAVLSVSRT